MPLCTASYTDTGMNTADLPMSRRKQRTGISSTHFNSIQRSCPSRHFAMLNLTVVIFTQPHHSIQLCQVVWPLSSFNSFIFFTFAHKVDGFFPLNLIFFIGIELWLKNGPSILGFAFGIFLASSSAIPSLLPDFASRHS